MAEEAPDKSWVDIIQRQRQERNDTGDSYHELLRSLPLEQKQERERGRGELPGPADEYEAMLREAARNAPQEHSQEHRIDP